jgi:hypothetical protein
MVISGPISKKEEKAILFFAERLFGRAMMRNLGIRIRKVKDFEVFGLVAVEDYNAAGKPRDFLIELKRGLEEKDFLETIAHELVHVRQYVRGELNEEMSYWRGAPVNAREIPYAEHPWEIEAEKIGKELVEEYMS